ncbi:Chromobox protein homolog hpl-1 [Caenorhabditis elegans]|uniref:Chromobox protein homolog hpl-1 n=1 Tax=Caenorhabditis elegans TaxID=6239 RepID=CBXH1_CAEEL|nr:Chromobox protein homolog hpl-1 [Caenorhabditis elegans]G5EET5.1 RecName: Full=Chromobox protein homolog hpl-1; AltName: Full=HP1-like heterochromatin protein 1 [Caenorhabditis elegans]AAC78602.1 heterochromatin protein 1 homolog [Caenorhabditis elegans]CAA94152.1 Chromobox protein homolog hpl-1 [Caenorhabditis elegans]|eukprot:NP_510199.1 HP1 Like (heterochromatin protein) [Caenorhabditis elegans]
MSRQNPVRSTRGNSLRAREAQQAQDAPLFQESSSNVFVVEKVLNKRLTRGGSEYYIKWQGFPESECSWEPIENLQCDRMIQEYEKEAAKRTTRKRRYSPQPSTSSSAELQPSTSDEWAGKTLKTIIGITKAPGELHFLCKFSDDSVHLIPLREANVRFPSQVIKFYETRLVLQGVSPTIPGGMS